MILETIFIALWLGILTSISPCPLATNIAAISFIVRKIEKSKTLILAGLLYSLGRMISYLILAIFIVKGLLAIPALSFFLQKYMNIIIGPVLIIAGMFLLELIVFNLGSGRITSFLKDKLIDKGFMGTFFLGAVFALAFCPVSAALFFGSLIPLSIKIGDPFIPSLFYGLGTALPVLGIVFLFLIGSKSIGSIFNKITVIEKWVRTFTGFIIILIGIYLSLSNIFKLW